ncbi:hypothetical protein FQR65_LT08735 [Abscondita terminalis]|nr:hypothetical protein FQR65_LT08735 [Abscondita terminalis]
MKWNTRGIVEFLNIYEQYPILWNIKDKNYSNTNIKDDIFKNLVEKLNEKQLTVGMDVKQLKTKIKTIKGVYRQEINEIEKSKKSGCGTEEVYTPKLAWFKDANFLAEVVVTRSSHSNYNCHKAVKSHQQTKTIKMSSQEIQNSIINAKLSSLEQEAPQSVHSAFSPFSDDSFASTSASSMHDDDRDVLQQVLINTFGRNTT